MTSARLTELITAPSKRGRNVSSYGSFLVMAMMTEASRTRSVILSFRATFSEELGKNVAVLADLFLNGVPDVGEDRPESPRGCVWVWTEAGTRLPGVLACTTKLFTERRSTLGGLRDALALLGRGADAERLATLWPRNPCRDYVYMG